MWPIRPGSEQSPHGLAGVAREEAIRICANPRCGMPAVGSPASSTFAELEMKIGFRSSFNLCP